MAVAFESISNTTYASRTNTTVTAPSGITNGDLLLAMFFILSPNTNAPPTPTAPSGFATVSGITQPLDTGAHGGVRGHSRLYYKIASSESGDYTWTHTTHSTQGVIARIQRGRYHHPVR